MHKLLQFLGFHQLVQMIMQRSIVLCHVSSILMIRAIQTLIRLGQVSSHLIEPFEITLIFYLLKDLIYRLLKYRVDYLCVIP